MPAIRGFPTSGLFQLFISDDLECFECDQIVGDEVVVIFLSEAQINEQGRDMSEYTSKQPWMLEGAPVQKIIGIKATHRIKYHEHKIGGVANFTQDREYSQYINFLQFDSSDGIMIGDAGIMNYAHICKEKRPRKPRFQQRCVLLRLILNISKIMGNHYD
ncbi:Protein_of Conserved hypothetical protein function DUF1963 [Hexamita inflata]|uniref:Uncharacterized protein n=1 Tax=Hexamita inflata TaxID=28002 RepID=A0AA86NV59_9EUKA|nr:Protein of Conserved hypothetical protein function DUF1963 [Hexamita inflata]